MNEIQIGNYRFQGPFLLSNFKAIDRAAVYAILCKGSNGEYTPLYIGETGELGTRLETHNKKDCWRKNCKGILYVAIYYTPSSFYTAEDRRKIERELIAQYRLICNEL